MQAILRSPDNRVQAFLAAGHVCAVMGFHEYVPIAEAHKVPIVVTGFEPVDLLRGMLAAVKQLEDGTPRAENAYERVVTFQGNRAAQDAIWRVFQPADRKWRGIGMIPLSGLGLRPEYAKFDAERRFEVNHVEAQESPLCIAGQILQGLKKPPQCAAYRRECRPESPLGAPMVSAEGACAAYHRFHPEALLHA
jgi:hydrogenase expression/formation protein HypD